LYVGLNQANAETGSGDADRQMWTCLTADPEAPADGREEDGDDDGESDGEEEKEEEEETKKRVGKMAAMVREPRE
jgi:hypothetical protein